MKGRRIERYAVLGTLVAAGLVTWQSQTTANSATCQENSRRPSWNLSLRRSGSPLRVTARMPSAGVCR